jgi:nitrous oxidase accessory protein
VSKSLFENMMDKNPALRLFQLSPAQQAIELAARAFPIFQPQPKFTDEVPLMSPVMPTITLPSARPAWPMWVTTLLLLAFAGGVISLAYAPRVRYRMSRFTQHVLWGNTR